MLHILRLLAVLAAACLAPPAFAVERPNIVVIMTDDQDDMGSLDHMPYVQRMMVERGTRFVNSFVDTSICCPSRATFMTGQSAVNHGVHTNGLPDGGYYKFAPREDNALPVWLQRAGYATALIGKVLNDYGDDDPTHVPPGWTEWRGLLKPAQAYFGNKVNVNGVVVRYPAETYVTDMIADEAVDFIERRGPGLQPFFLLLTSPAPHDSGAGAGPPKPAPRHDGVLAGETFPEPPNFNEADVSDKPSVIRTLPMLDAAEIAATALKRQKRAESLLAVDEMVRKVIAALRRTGALDRTIIVFTSDNGYSLGSHRWDRKYLPYEESIRVPLAIRGPGIPENETRAQIVGNVDIAATIIDWSGALPGNLLDGRSLAPVLADASTPWRGVLGLHGFEPGKAFKGARSRTMMFAQYETAAGIEEEIYDLATDPQQMVNRAGDPACQAAVTAMRAAAVALAMCQGAACWIETEPPSCQLTGHGDRKR